MDSETLERIKRDMEANRFKEAALTVVSLSDGLDLVAEVEQLREAISLSGVTETMKKFTAEIERLEGLNQELKSQLLATQIELEQLQIEADAYDKYIKGGLSLGQLEEALKGTK